MTQVKIRGLLTLVILNEKESLKEQKNINLSSSRRIFLITDKSEFVTN